MQGDLSEEVCINEYVQQRCAASHYCIHLDDVKEHGQMISDFRIRESTTSVGGCNGSRE